jgi:hypothetical protein
MMEWLITLGVVVILAVALPAAIGAARRSARGSGRMAGVALSIGLAFSMLVDPRKPETIEHIAKRPANGEDDDRQGETRR